MKSTAYVQKLKAFFAGFLMLGSSLLGPMVVQAEDNGWGEEDITCESDAEGNETFDAMYLEVNDWSDDTMMVGIV